jgi:transcriptional regulator with GAF, ATPase, and Fis domain
VLAKASQVAPTDSTVLVLGETGTGKELIARAVRSASKRKDKPLIKLNCSALPTGLVESELFGHEKGAFTGATEKRTGRFELADGGTIFLDEVGELAPEVQAKLLRGLQERELPRHARRSQVLFPAGSGTDSRGITRDRRQGHSARRPRLRGAR